MLTAGRPSRSPAAFEIRRRAYDASVAAQTTTTDLSAPRKKALKAKKPKTATVKPPPIVQTSGLVRLPAEVVAIIAREIEHKHGPKSTRILLALSNTCRALHSAFDAVWPEHICRRFRITRAVLHDEMVHNEETARENLLDRIHDLCIACGGPPRPDLLGAFGFPLCFNCQRTDKEYGMTKQVR